MIYAMSDIHGCIKELKEKMELVDLEGENRIIFLGDYMDYGSDSCQVLQYIRELQEQYGDKKVKVLKGNHEKMFLEWIDDYSGTGSGVTGDIPVFNDWIVTDFETGVKTISSFLSEEQMDLLKQTPVEGTDYVELMSRKAVDMILSGHEDLINWIRKMPLYYETDSRIFVHAGVDEEKGDYWIWATSEDYLLCKYPATTGKFYKTVIAGHVGTGVLAGDPDYHDIYFDGKSHLFIDGSVYKGGKLLLLACDEHNEKYYQVEKDGQIPVKKYH